MKILLSALVGVLLISISSGCTNRSNENDLGPNPDQPTVTTAVTPSKSMFEVHEDYTASFGITTNGTERIFTSQTYHNQSPDVYIELPDPSIVHVKAPDITWDMFFKTLPFTVEKECLITGTKQTFCTSETGTLRFFVNDVEDPDALDRLIQPSDQLRITYENQ